MHKPMNKAILQHRHPLFFYYLVSVMYVDRIPVYNVRAFYEIRPKRFDQVLVLFIH